MLIELETLLGFTAHAIFVFLQCIGSFLKIARVLEVARDLWFMFVRLYSSVVV